MKTLQWLEKKGGLDAATKMANERAGLIYGAMAANADSKGGFAPWIDLTP